MTEDTPSRGTRYADRALLPEGLRDDLPPWAEYEATIVERLLATFAARGYERVAPPLIEFEESLLAGPGSAHSKRLFRLLDPESQRVMALRTDMTQQVARIAETRLSDRPRPLRLSYAGHVLRVKGSQLRPTRQFRQAGVELIGSGAREADLEIMTLAREALEAIGVAGLTIDLTAPRLVSTLAHRFGLSDEALATARQALDTKDVGALDALDGPACGLLKGLLEAAGPARGALDRLAALDLPDDARAIVDQLADIAGDLMARDPDLVVTVDPGEYRGFEYKTGVGFAVFAKGVRGELARGGRYDALGADGQTEPATGFSLYLDSLLRALPAPLPVDRVYLPFKTDPGEGARLRRDGWRTVQGLEPVGDAAAQARRLGCSHLLRDGEPVPLATEPAD